VCSPLRSRRHGQAQQDMPIRLIRLPLSTKDSRIVHKSNTARQMLKTLAQALERIRNGNFGECAECGGDIEPKRLEAIPWARYCVKCQEAREQG
jgi:DnaK suppressor protein